MIFVSLLQTFDNLEVCPLYFGSSLATTVVSGFYSGGWSLLTLPPAHLLFYLPGYFVFLFGG